MRFALVCTECFDISWRYQESMPWHMEPQYRRWWVCIDCTPIGGFAGEF